MYGFMSFSYFVVQLQKVQIVTKIIYWNFYFHLQTKALCLTNFSRHEAVIYLFSNLIWTFEKFFQFYF